jgi:hypothetical protein
MNSTCHSSHLSAVSAVALASCVGLPGAVLAQQSGESGGVSASLSEKLILSEAAIKGLTESLAVANGETELFKRKYDDLNTRVEALGIASTGTGKETEALQTRLIAAVRDLRLIQKENDRAYEQLVRLTESVIDLLKTSEGINPKARLKVEEELRAAQALTSNAASPKENAAESIGLTSGTVIDYKPDLALIVANLGARQGVKNGMPFQVWRGDRQVATARIVDVRDSISGAIVQATASVSETVHSGDTLRIDTTR